MLDSASISLLPLIVFRGNVDGLVRLGADIQHIKSYLAGLTDAKKSLIARLDLVSKEDSSFHRIRHACEVLDLASSTKHADRIIAGVKNQSLTYGDIARMAEELLSRIVDEAEGVAYFHVERDKVKHFGVVAAFGNTVNNAFPGAIIDIEEAGNCLALGRDTACVMHLMRVMESGIGALAASLRLNSDFKTWDATIKKLRAELEVSYPQMDASMKGKREFYVNAFDRLTAVKDAHRHPTMHARKHYDSDRAEEMFRAVRSFMQLVAEELTEVES